MISRLAKFFADLDGLWFSVTLVASVGLLGYVGMSWLSHLASAGQYVLALAVAGALLVAAATALLRIPVAQMVVLGSAVACGAGFLLGYGNVFLP
ncbi:MAG: hypothetical protein KIT73_13080 [Burkholderiales bacterium]|nr:hypothetical protein [Burkholderiales bacterium]